MPYFSLFGLVSRMMLFQKLSNGLPSLLADLQSSFIKSENLAKIIKFPLTGQNRIGEEEH